MENYLAIKTNEALIHVTKCSNLEDIVVKKTEKCYILYDADYMKCPGQTYSQSRFVVAKYIEKRGMGVTPNTYVVSFKDDKNIVVIVAILSKYTIKPMNCTL